MRERTVAQVVVSWALLALAVTAAWSLLFALSFSGLQEGHAQRTAYAALRKSLATQTAPLGGVIEPGTPVALLDAPSLGLRDVVVVEGTASGDLQRGPGHRRDTVLPGQVGTSVVYGRTRLFGAPFDRVPSAHVGDTVAVVTGQGRFTYTVTGTRHVGDPLPTLLPAGASRLTLVTASDASAGRLWSGGQPVYVDAALKGTAAPSPGVAVAMVPRAEQAMRGDTSALLLVVLWLPLLLAISVAVVWATLHWGFVQAWVVGVPLLLLALWGTSEAAAQLLPNLV